MSSIAGDARHSKEVLEPHNIFYVESLCQDGKYDLNDNDDKMFLKFLGNPIGPAENRRRPPPDHVESVRQTLIDFPIFETFASKDEDENEVKILRYLGEHFPQLLAADTSNSEKWFDNVYKGHRIVKEKALKLAEDGSSESKWQKFLAHDVFDTKDLTTFYGDDILAALRHLVRAEVVQWTGKDWMRAHTTGTSRPVCDMTFGFRVWKPDEILIEDGTGFSRKELSFNTLQDLSKLHQCHSMPMHRPDKGSVPSKERLMAFPFATVELKMTNIPEKRHLAEEKNRIQNLWHAAGRDDDTIPPVLSFTCIGPITTLWMTFPVTGGRNKNTGPVNTGHAMIPVFQADLSKVLGVITLRRVYANVLLWSLEELRPRLTGMIRTIIESGNAADQHSRLKIPEIYKRSIPMEKSTPKRAPAPRATTEPQSVPSKANGKLDPVSLSRPRAKSADSRVNVIIVHRAVQAKAGMSKSTRPEKIETKFGEDAAQDHITSSMEEMCESLSDLAVKSKKRRGKGTKESLSSSEGHDSAPDEGEDCPSDDDGSESFIDGTHSADQRMSPSRRKGFQVKFVFDNGSELGEESKANDTPSKKPLWGIFG